MEQKIRINQARLLRRLEQLATIGPLQDGGVAALAVVQALPIRYDFYPRSAGISHSPAEYSSPQDPQVCANVLRQSVLKLASLKKQRIAKRIPQ